MKKVLVVGVIMSAFFLSGCSNKPKNDNPAQKQTPAPIGTLDQNGVEENTTPKITEKTQGDLKEFTISEAGIKIEFPKDYEIVKNTEENRRGSFASYDLSNKGNLPSFQEIQFFSKESIEKFTKNCADSPCFFGDFPNTERYNGQKNALEANKDYLVYKLKKFDDRSYFTSNFKCNGDSCVIREYTTFIGSTKIDVWITMENESQIIEADKLFESFKIIE